VPPSAEEDANALDVGAVPCAAGVVLDEDVADRRDVDDVEVVGVVELAVKPLLDPDLVVEAVDDCLPDAVAVEDSEPAV